MLLVPRSVLNVPVNGNLWQKVSTMPPPGAILVFSEVVDDGWRYVVAVTVTVLVALPDLTVGL